MALAQTSNCEIPRSRFTLKRRASVYRPRIEVLILFRFDDAEVYTCNNANDDEQNHADPEADPLLAPGSLRTTATVSLISVQEPVSVTRAQLTLKQPAQRAPSPNTAPRT